MAINSTCDVIKGIQILAQADPGIAAVWLYGSRSNGTHGPYSDYDLAVAFSEFCKNDPLERRLRPELLAMDWCRTLQLTEGKLSIVDINQAAIPLAFSAISGKLLFERDNNRRMREESRVMSMYELDYNYTRKAFGE